jgi:hypothetical protein
MANKILCKIETKFSNRPGPLGGGREYSDIEKTFFQIKPSWSSQLIDLRILMTKR